MTLSNIAHKTHGSVHCFAPSKLILSGEHAILYHCPALSMAIDLKTHCYLSQQPAESGRFTIQLQDFDLEKSFSFADWQQQSQQIEKRFQQFQQTQLAIDAVLTSPFDLILITLWLFNQQHPIQTEKWQIKIGSEVPIGRGLGSSAAVIVGLLAGLFKSHQLIASKESLLDLAKKIESYQHGASSGLDPATLIQGGLLKYQMDQPLQTLSTQPLSGWLIDTGAPLSHTGECVQAVKQHHQYNSELWREFKNTSFEIEQAWSNKNSVELKQAIQHNQNLLCQIGVVPKKVQAFIQQLDSALNAASKVCGAGSVLGDNAGMVLCLSEHSPVELCQQYGYDFWPLKLQPQGVQCELA
ncbi:MAG: GHMP kinase [Pseudomonadota bacterium]|nr:GHMP kinase [Pseudomonadota bacterium]